MAVISGTIGAYTNNLLFTFPSLQTANQFKIGFPDVLGGPLSSVSYTNGTGSSQVDLIYWPDPITLAATTQTIDLTSLTDPSGAAVNFARVRELLIYNPTATAGFDIKVEQGASNPWAFVPPSTSPQIVRYGGGLYRISDPISTGGGNGNVVGGASKTIKFDSGANTVTFWVLALGGSAA
jgi:hypothetical protein